MESKNKSIITIEQINENLKKQFPGKSIVCTEINENEIYIQSDIMNIVITEKKIFKMATTESMMEYKKLVEGYHLAFIAKHFKYAVYIPFVPFRRIAGDKLKEQESKVLFACELKKEKKESSLDRLKAIGGRLFVDIYKMVQQLEITNVYFEENERGIERLHIEHTKGKCAFPIVDCNEAYEGELKDIFLGMIKIPVNKEIMHFPESINLYTESKMVS